MPELRQHSLFFGTREPNPSSAPAHSLTSPRCRPVPRSTSSQPAANQHSPLRQDASHASLPSTSAPRHNSPDASAPVQARTSPQPLKARQSTARSATVPLKSSSTLVPNHSSKTSRLPTVKPLFTPSRNNSTPQRQNIHPDRPPFRKSHPAQINNTPQGITAQRPVSPSGPTAPSVGRLIWGAAKLVNPPQAIFSSHRHTAPRRRSPGEKISPGSPVMPRNAAPRPRAGR